LYKYIIDKQFTDSAFAYDITNISSIDDLKGYQMYPMIIYTKPQGYPKYVILHYFTIIKSGIKYYILSSWGSDTICVLPSIAPIKEEEFSSLSTLLENFNIITDENRDKCMELVKNIFLVNAVPMYSDPNSEAKGALVMATEGIKLEQKTFYRTQSYHIAVINGYNDTINRMVYNTMGSNTINSRKNRNNHNRNRNRNRKTNRSRNRNRSPTRNHV